MKPVNPGAASLLRIAISQSNTQLLGQSVVRGLLPAICLLLPVLAIAQDERAAQRPEEVTITATRLPRTIENIAGTVSVVTDEILAKELADDLDDLVRFQPGVTLNTAARGGNQGFTIRGIGGNRVLTVVDGVRGSDIYAAGPSSYGKDSFEMDTLKSVEIIRGPASVLYGADAMGGAVILNSKTARDYVGADQGTHFDLRTSAADADSQYKGGLTAAWQNESVGVLAQATHREFEEQEVGGSGRLNPQDGESDSLLLKGFFSLSESSELRVSLEDFQEKNLTDVQSELSTSVTSSLGRDETQRQRFGIEYLWQADSALFDDLQLVANYQATDAIQNTIQERTSYSFINPRDPSTFGGTAAIRTTDFEFNQHTTALNLNLRKAFAGDTVSHALAYGLNWDDTQTERPRNRCEQAIDSGLTTCEIAGYPFAPTENFPNKTFPDSATERFGVYLQDEITFGDSGFVLIPGIRYDGYQLEPSVDALLDGTGDIEQYGGFRVTPVDESQVSLSLGALYDFNETYSLFAQYAEGYRPPNFDESNQAFVNLGHRYATVPNPDLTAESSQGIEIGLRASLDNAYLSLAAYHNRYEDFIESNFVGMHNNSISLFQDQNLGEVEIRGVEATANVYFTSQWQLRSSIAYARGDNERDGTPVDSVDPLTAVFGLGYDQSGGKWGGELLLTAVAEKDRVSSPTAVTADAYTVTDLVGYLNLTDNATLRLGVFNVFDETYARWANIQGLNATSLDTIANAAQPGTNFRVGFNLQF